VEELITRIANNVGLPAETAERVVAIVLDFFKNNASQDNVSGMIAALPGAEDLLANVDLSGSAGGTDGAASGGLGGMLGSAMGALTGGNPLMDTLSKLQGEGLSMDQAKSAGSEIVAFAKDKAGAEAVDKVLGEIPGLSSIL